LRHIGASGFTAWLGITCLYHRNSHDWYKRSASYRREQVGNALRGMPSIVRMHRRIFIGPQHEYDKRQRRMDFNALSQADKTISARLVRIIPNRTTTIQAVFNDTDSFSGRRERIFHDTRPALVEGQPLTRRGN